MKPSIYKPQFTILVDSREKLPYSFAGIPSTSKAHGPFDAPWEWAYLSEGDYQLKGAPPRLCAIERKSLEDLYATLGGNRERFEREIERLAGYEFAAVMIEATLAEVMNPQAARGDTWRSQLHPRSVFETISSWEQKYDVHFIYAGTRRLAEIKAFSILQKAHRRLMERQEAAKEVAAVEVSTTQGNIF